MREILRAMMSLLVVTTFAAVGVFVGLLFALHVSGGFNSMGIGPSSLQKYHDGLLLVGGASGFALALPVVWGIYRNSAFFRWVGATTISAPAILLAYFNYSWGWGYPLIYEIAALLLPVLCGAVLYSEATAARKGGGSAGA